MSQAKERSAASNADDADVVESSADGDRFLVDSAKVTGSKDGDNDDNDDVLSTGVLEVPPSLVVAPDGGWGWMIVVVSFLCASVVDGLCAAFGVMLPSLVTYFEQPSSKTALAGSLLAGGFLMFGTKYHFTVIDHRDTV